MAPYCMVFGLLLSLCSEGLEPISVLIYADRGSAATAALVLLSAGNAYFLNVANFAVTRAVGAVSLQVLGIVKSIVAILASAWWFGNPVTDEQAWGCVICLGGVALYHAQGRTILLKTSNL